MVVSLLNFSRDRFTVSATIGSFRLSVVGQSGHVFTMAAAGTEKEYNVLFNENNYYG